MTPENFPCWVQYLLREKNPIDAYYLNTEGRISYQQGKTLRTEEYLQIEERIIIEEPGCVLTIDTFTDTKGSL